MFDKLIHQAIKAALDSDWKKAIALNLKALESNPQDIETILRLARAYQKEAKIKEAKKTYRQALKINRFNRIAKRELAKLKLIKNSSYQTNNPIKNIDIFLEEPGKTKVVSVIKLASNKILLELDNADELNLSLGKYSISVKDKKNRYLGKLPSNISLRLIKLINRGNKYLVLVKAVGKNKLKVFIKEIKQSKKNINTASFF